jgi:hypothetical protein
VSAVQKAPDNNRLERTRSHGQTGAPLPLNLVLGGPPGRPREAANEA